MPRFSGYILTVSLIFISFLVPVDSAFQQQLEQDQQNPTTVYPRVEWANHKIEKIYFNKDGSFVLIDDGSLWRINPEDANNLDELQTSYKGSYVTFMPENGLNDYPVKIIVDKHAGYLDHLIHIGDFNAALEVPPSSPETLQVSRIHFDWKYGWIITVQSLIKDELSEHELWIGIPFENWSEGDRVLIGGVWFPEYDRYQRSQYGIYTIYNYETKEFLFWDVIPKH